MRFHLAALVLLALAMTSSAEMSPETKEEVEKMMGSVMGDLETMMEEKKGEAPEGEMSEQTKGELEVLRGLMAALKGKDMADLEAEEAPGFESLLNPAGTRRKRGFFSRFKSFRTWLSFGVDVGKAFARRFFQRQ